MSRNLNEGIYLGHIEGGKREIFSSPTQPTHASHGDKYLSVVGPFRTRDAAEFMAQTYPNPNVQTVDDAEAAVATRKRSGEWSRRGEGMRVSRSEKIVERLLREEVSGIVHYNADLYGTNEGDRIEAEAEKLAAKFGGEYDGSGMGFGARELFFYFKDRAMANGFLAQAVKIKGLKVQERT